MDFRVFDLLFAAVIGLGIAVAVVAPSLEAPYPDVITAAYAAGAAAFLYLTVRVKFAGIMKKVEQQLGEVETTAAGYRQATDKTLAGIEKALRELREQLAVGADKNTRELDPLRRGLTDVVSQINRHIENVTATFAAMKNNEEAAAAETHEHVAAAEKTATQAAALIGSIRDDFNAYVSDEQHFRKIIESQLAERVSYLEDFIREKRKSLQI